MQFRDWAAKLEFARLQPEQRRLVLLADLLSELEASERAPAIYLLQGRLGLTVEPRCKSNRSDSLGSIVAQLSRDASRADGPALQSPSVCDVYRTLHELVPPKKDWELPPDYPQRLQGLVWQLDRVSLTWLARVLYGRLARDETLIKVLALVMECREPGLAYIAARQLKKLYQRTIPDLGWIAESLFHMSFFELAQLGPQYGIIVPREEIRIWKTVDEAWNELRSGHVFVQGKLDGEHIQIHKKDEQVILLAVSGEDVTARLPDVAGLILDTLAGSAILDTEVVGFDPATGRVLLFYNTLHSRRHQGIVFDLLSLDGIDWRAHPYLRRRQKLRQLFSTPNTAPGVFAPQEVETHTLADTRDAVQSFLSIDTYEGVILKDALAPCKSGQPSSRRGKYKRYTSLDSVLLGYNAGQGSYLVGLWRDRQHTALVPYRTVEKIQNAEERERIIEFCQKNTLSRVPSIVLPGPNPEHWVEPELVVDVECDGMKRPSSKYIHAGYTLNRGVTIRGISEGKSIHQANDLSRLKDLNDAPGE